MPEQPTATVPSTRTEPNVIGPRKQVEVAHNGEIVTITLDRPGKKNALDAAGWAALGDALDTVASDPDARVLIITGAGEDFCSGTDLAGNKDNHPTTSLRRLNRAATALMELPIPVIARVQGVAVGAGWNIALCCDFVVAATTARFSQIFVDRGLSPDFGGTWLLPRLVGLQRAKQLTMLPELIGADQAAQLGLVTWVVPPEELDRHINDIAHRLAAGPPVALSQTKALINSSSAGSLRCALEAEGRAQVVNFATTDAQAAREAFLTKTAPNFTGGWIPHSKAPLLSERLRDTQTHARTD
ncbi:MULTISPECIES: enoyl-CoA hydratase/isomerase family protein [Tsukamurella]|uniref:Enoyl-CoA hydratase n=2 Tax=Tsukamurella TaxID=2060 RepID=A0A5C5RZH5_9ACTN|nr:MULTISPECIES: enoyl-CoA hydratase-related protein [Tsukamurella]NMD55933.1 enoyl-CoA hydratase [Tsukamurella columbiensis]TWS27615.1 enoyl-CoA hydratase [Tsukamurella conjunctivitidis]